MRSWDGLVAGQFEAGTRISTDGWVNLPAKGARIRFLGGSEHEVTTTATADSFGRVELRISPPAPLLRDNEAIYIEEWR
jgi:hypothetical protein